MLVKEPGYVLDSQNGLILYMSCRLFFSLNKYFRSLCMVLTVFANTSQLLGNIILNVILCV